MIDMSMSKEGMLFLASLEGLALQPYLCDSNWKTISLGVTKSDIPDLPIWPWTKTITIAQAMSFVSVDKMYKFSWGVI